MRSRLIVILGPTATGKTRLSARLAYEFNGEIISADSRQVYKGMDIGTGKDLNDFLVEGKKIKYHLIDIIKPSEEFNLYLFIKYFNQSFNKIIKKEKIPFLVGGTGLYISSVLQKYNLKQADFSSRKKKELQRLSIEELKNILLNLKSKIHNTTDLLDKDRIIKAILIELSREDTLSVPKEVSSLVIGINPGREEVKKNITARLKKRLEEGMIDEVKSLISEGIPLKRLYAFGLEYKLIAMYLNNELSYEEMFEKLNGDIHKFAKRQMTWFRKMQREGVNINWIEGPDFEPAKKLIENYLKQP
ncbi:MAG TPA: tRNA (adenosine(37)-N6)-dimethylallyltransferase MiaA [Ignavibacteriaceae bacterium]|nr:tRNA (adenosine(37)-N6)-dimethylallyltransferase MiaA [Ignavibacteriaceae bacterium]